MQCVAALCVADSCHVLGSHSTQRRVRKRHCHAMPNGAELDGDASCWGSRRETLPGKNAMPCCASCQCHVQAAKANFINRYLSTSKRELGSACKAVRQAVKQRRTRTSLAPSCATPHPDETQCVVHGSAVQEKQNAVLCYPSMSPNMFR